MEQLPTAIGRFRIEALLGRGAMGVVYRAHDPDIDRTVAIKLIRADLLDGDSREQYLTRFRNEAKVAGRCVHPNIVGVHDFAVHEGNPYLVMEYVDGVDLGRAFGRGVTAPVVAVVRIALQVLDALAYAHGFGIVHRDIKPANILLTAGSDLAAFNIKVTDFGISRLTLFEFTQSTSLVGTPSYMSPEQCRGGQIDLRCDLFSLGCVLYELLTGERAFGGESYPEILYKLTHTPHRPLHQARPDVDQGLADIIDRALAKRPEDRFADARAMAAAIRLLSSAAAPGASEAAAAHDGEPATIVRPFARGRPSGGGPATGAVTGSDLGRLDGSSLNTIERQLAHHLGPMAGYHLRRALRDARSADEFCQRLTDLLPQESQRIPFRGTLELAFAGREFRSTPAPTAALPPAAPGPEISADSVERVTRALAQVMGPIAARLVARARAKAATPAELETLCADMIDRPGERERFRTLLGRAP